MERGWKLRRNWSMPQLNILDDYFDDDSLKSWIMNSKPDSVDWEAIMEDEEQLMDDSLKYDKSPVDETGLYTTQVYHQTLRDKYQLLERNGIKPLEVFLKEAIYTVQEQDNILRLWLGYQDNQGCGEVLFSFLDEEYLSTEVYEKFVDFHISVAAHNHYGEMTFHEFVKMYQLLQVQYMSKNSFLGRLFRKAETSSGYSSEDHVPEDDEWSSYRAKLLHSVEYVKVSEGGFLFKQDDPLTHIYFVFYGTIQTYRLTKDGQKQIIGAFSNGSHYGALELITNQKLIVYGAPAPSSYGVGNRSSLNNMVYCIKLPVEGFKQLIAREQDLLWSIVSTTLLNMQCVQTVLYSEALSMKTNTVIPSSPAFTEKKRDLEIRRNSSLASISVEPIVASQECDVEAILNRTFPNDPIVKKLLGLIQSNSPDCVIHKAKTGEYVYRNGDEASSVYILLKGKVSRILNLYFDKEVHLIPGSIMGEYSLLSGQNRTSSLRCLSRCTYIKISKEALIQLTKNDPCALFSFVKPRWTEITSHIKLLEYGYEYFTLRNGQNCVSPGDAPNQFYFLVQGRLREYKQDNGQMVHVREYSNPGATIGITRLLENQAHTTFITAVRDTELVRLDKACITQLMGTNPMGIQNLIRTSLLHEDIEETNDEAMAPKRLVAIVPLYSQVPIEGFTGNLVKSLKKHGKITVLTEHRIQKRFGKIHNLSLLSNERQNIWHYITGEEKRNDFVICLAKPNLSPWTRWILQQVDCILVVGHEGLNCNGITEWERTLGLYDSESYLAEKRLIVMHKKRSHIEGTRHLLEHRRLAFHHHLYEGNKFHYDSIARFLSGTAVGLVLGGGGARGLSHIGVIQALREHGVPFDIIGGTSIGSQVGALLAREISLIQISQQLWATYSHVWQTHFGKFSDMTLPYLSLTTGQGLSNSIRNQMDGERYIEDLRVPFFCISCNITQLQPYLHTSGIVWEALRASSSVPLVFPPFILPSGDALVDGCYVNNVPADVMRKKYGANLIIAVDVGDNSHITPMKYNSGSISGWKILLDSTFRGRKYATIYEVLLQLAGIMDWGNQASRPKYMDMEIRPKMDGVDGWLDFDQHDELIKRGYTAAKKRLLEMKKENPTIWVAITDKVKYPPTLLAPPKPVPQQKATFIHYLVPLLFNPKVLIILIVCFGIYKIASNLISILRILGTISKFFLSAMSVAMRLRNSMIPHYTRL